MSKPIIGIIGRVSKDEDCDNIICLYDDIRIAIIKKGGIPLLITPMQEYKLNIENKIKMTETEKQDLIRIIDKCDGIIIPGGYNWYEFDEFIYNYAYKKDIPILGICLGMQMMALMDNNSSLDITEKNNTLINHCQKNMKYVHNIEIIDNTYLSRIIGEKNIKVNSRHNYHAPRVNNLNICAYSEDGLIEAIEDPNKKFVLGVQWHPESMIEYDEYANMIFDEFIKKSNSNV